MLLAITTSVSAQVIEQVEGETTIRSEDGGQTIAVELPGGVPLEMVWIEPGTFVMGEIGIAEPVHQVTISRGFYLGRYELTQAQWEAVMGSNPSAYKGANQPVENVSWDDVQTFIQRLNETAGVEIYRLPTEAEWEYAARAGTMTRWSFGDDESQLGDYAWYDKNAWDIGLQWAQQVGTKLPNPWGLYDMYGNVWEWVQDRYRPYSGDAVVDPVGPAGFFGVLRGGGYWDSARFNRSANRSSADVVDYIAWVEVGYNYDTGARLWRTGPKLTGATAIPSHTWGQVKQEGR